MSKMPLISAVVACLMLSPVLVLAQGEPPSPAAMADEIRTAATQPNDGENGRPLPLITHWTSGESELSKGFRLPTQLSLIEQGHYLLPWVTLPTEKTSADVLTPADFQRLAQLNLPFTMISSQWEKRLTNDPKYFELPPEQNPNVVGVDGQIMKKVSPFGPVEYWRKVGKSWTDTPRMKELQRIYPDPPLVIFLSNNEHHKLRWTDVETSKRYLDLYGPGRDDAFKRKVVADGWIERYRALQEGMREGLVSPAWREKAIFAGYNAFGLEHMGRWGGWENYALNTSERADPNPLMWDGGSPSYYTHNWNPSTDYKTWSPQIEFMNDVFLLFH